MKPNVQAYAAAFECLVNKKETCSIDILKKLSKQFFSDVRFTYILNNTFYKLLFIF